jgi:peptidoglycan/LPS O-acetylase OafA/YrhL
MITSSNISMQDVTVMPAVPAGKTATRFRPDIEGLRAVAVASVVLYHLDIGWAPGGFVGVDIFFIISGFLMAQIVASEIDKNVFNPWRFFERRIFRIWPAMLVVVLVTLVVGAATMVPDDLLDLGWSALSSLTAVNNIFFWQQSGYFAPDAQRNVLLHLWSLAVEQQFYLTMPILMAAAFWRTRQSRVWVVLAVTVASLVVCIYATPRAHAASFFLLPTRYWEFGLGALVALGGARFRLGFPSANIVAAAGAAMIVGAVIGLGRENTYPGSLALLPSVGAASVIWAGMFDTPTIGRILSLASLRFIGRISYSLYLWHWPLITFCRDWGLAIDTPPMQVSLLALSVVAAYLSWRFVEKPFRVPSPMPARQRIATVAAGGATIAVAGVVFTATAGMPSRLDPDVRAMLAYQHYSMKEPYRLGTCFLTLNQDPAGYRIDECAQATPGRPRVLLWGDSHAAHYAPGLRSLADKLGIDLVQANYAGCSPIPRRPDNSQTCAEFGRTILNLVESHRFDRVILSANWTGYPNILTDLSALLHDLGARGIDVVVFGPSMEFRRALPILLASRPAALFARARGPQDWLTDNVRLRNRQMQQALDGLPRVAYVAPISELCHDETCPVLVDGRVPLVWDGSHLTAEGSALVVAALLPRLAAALDVTAAKDTRPVSMK